MKTQTIASIYKRRSIRKYKQDCISDKDILEILSTGNMAPSASNSQPWQFIVIKKHEIKQLIQNAVSDKLNMLDNKINSPKAKKMLEGYRQYMNFIIEVPVIIAVISLPYKSVFTSLVEKYNDDEDKKDFHVSTGGIQSVAAAIQNILLASSSMGYGTCWMTGPMIAEKAIAEILKVNKKNKPIALIPIGIPDEDMENKKYNRIDVKEKIIWM